MFCPNCGKQISEDSKFCQYCSFDLVLKKTEKTEEKVDDVLKYNSKLWYKFAEIYDSKGEDKKKYTDFSSNETWELINRIYNNNFETFISDNKEQFNKLPYTAMEKIKAIYNLCIAGGYWFWMAEYLLKYDLSGKLKQIDLEKFIEEWKKIAIDNYQDNLSKISNELSKNLEIFFNFQLNNLLELAPAIKDLPNETVEKLKMSLMLQIIWGYFIGLTEEKYRIK